MSQSDFSKRNYLLWTWMVRICFKVTIACKMQDGWRNIPLIGACQEGHAETAQVLLDCGAIADYQNKVQILPS